MYKSKARRPSGRRLVCLGRRKTSVSHNKITPSRATRSRAWRFDSSQPIKSVNGQSSEKQEIKMNGVFVIRAIDVILPPLFLFASFSYSLLVSSCPCMHACTCLIPNPADTPIDKHTHMRPCSRTNRRHPRVVASHTRITHVSRTHTTHYKRSQRSRSAKCCCAPRSQWAPHEPTHQARTTTGRE